MSPVDENFSLCSFDHDRLVPVGYFSKAHGIRGELVMILQAESAEVLKGYIFARPRHGGMAKPYKVTQVRRHHGSLLVTLDGVKTRNDAELLRSHTVFVLEDELPPLEEDEIYLKDLPGLRVFIVDRAASGAAGKEPLERELGIIHEVSCPAGQDLWTIVTSDGKEILFPAVDAFILSIEPEKGVARIAPPPGLLELYLGG